MPNDLAQQGSSLYHQPPIHKQTLFGAAYPILLFPTRNSLVSELLYGNENAHSIANFLNPDLL